MWLTATHSPQNFRFICAGAVPEYSPRKQDNSSSNCNSRFSNRDGDKEAKLTDCSFKILHRTYYTKSRLSKIYPNVDDRCDRCKSDKADLIHMFWSCQKLTNYWTLVFKILNEAFNLNITPCVEIAIFGVPEHGIPLTNNMENVFAFASLLARRRILLEWKSKSPPKT